MPLYYFSPDEGLRGSTSVDRGGPNENFFVFDALTPQ